MGFAEGTPSTFRAQGRLEKLIVSHGRTHEIEIVFDTQAVALSSMPVILFGGDNEQSRRRSGLSTIETLGFITAVRKTQGNPLNGSRWSPHPWQSPAQW
jgi:hypothetical protein